MSRYINDDAKIEAGTRLAAKVSIDQLANSMFNQAKLIADDPLSFNDISVQDLIDESENAVYWVIANLLCFDSTIDRDNEYYVRADHCVTEINDFGVDIGDSLAGFHTINELTFFGFFAGTPQDHAVFMIIYHDGKQLRLYTPIRGNMVNVDYKTVIGRELEKADEETIEKYRQMPMGESRLDDLYVQKYGYDMADFEVIGLNHIAIKEDILTAFVAI